MNGDIPKINTDSTALSVFMTSRDYSIVSPSPFFLVPVLSADSYKEQLSRVFYSEEARLGTHIIVRE